MDGLTIGLLIAVTVSAVLALVFLIRNLRMRAEMKAFREQINEIRTTDREQPIKVASFDASTVGLAQEINRLILDLRRSAIRSAEEEKRVRTIMAGVSHDFRTPLTAADGYLQMSKELLEGKEMTEQDLKELRDYLKIVSERIRYLRQLSDEFFEVTYLDARQTLPLEAVRFDTVLSEVALGQYDKMQERRVDMRLDVPEEQMQVRADRHYLERILENLFSNAEKYARSFLEIRVEKTETSGQTGAGRLTGAGGQTGAGRQTGAGGQSEAGGQTGGPGSTGGPCVRLVMRNDIEENLRIDSSHIFDPFYRAPGRTGPGTGLGLYVCKELADAMHFELRGEIRDGIFETELVMPSYKDEMSCHPEGAVPKDPVK